MKVLHFIYALGQGGAERFVIDLSNEQSIDNEVKLYAFRDDSIDNQGFFVSEIGNKVTYTNLKIKPGFKPLLSWKFYKILKAERPDVVHCHLNLVNYFFLSSLIFKNKIRFVYTLHSPPEAEVGSELEKNIRRFFFSKKFFTPVAISDETKNSFKAFYRLNYVKVIYNGRSFSGKSKDYQLVLKEIDRLKPSKKSLVFCHLARYNKLKNQKMLIQVFNKLKDEGLDYILLIIGEGFEKEHELKSLANKQIHFLGVKSNVMDYLYSSDAFCLTSFYEGMPISLIEALATGCIPICTPVGGIVNTIQHGKTGYLSKGVSEYDYINAVREFIKDRDRINRNKLVEIFNGNFSIGHCSKSYMALYKEKY